MPPRLASTTAEARLVREIIAMRRLRRDMLGLEPRDVAWGIMLELYAARLEGRRVHQTGLAVAAGVAQTTALATIHKLIGGGLFTTEQDAGDGRLVIIGLTDKAADRMRAYLAATGRIAAARAA